MNEISGIGSGLHDASLIRIVFDWASRGCEIHFRGSPAADLRDSFTIVFERVAKMVVPTGHPWGPSASVLEVRFKAPDEYVFVMQSGDDILVQAEKISLRKAAS